MQPLLHTVCTHLAARPLAALRRLLPVLLLLVLLAPGTRAQAQEELRLILDWFPNADHVPLYVAQEAGFFAEEGLEVELVPPADPNDPLKLVAAGRAPFAINYQPNVIIARSRGLPVKAVGTLVENPLSSLAFLERSGIETPADLEGKRIGYSVQNLELALLRAVAASAGLTPDDYETVNVNFNLTASLLTGQVDAVIGAYWNYELAELELEGVAGDYFDITEHGVPHYRELVVISNDSYLAENEGVAARLVRAVQAAIDFSRENPERALAHYFEANPDVRKELDRRAFELVIGEFAHSQGLDAATWADFGEFLLHQGVIEEVPPGEDLVLNPQG